VADIALADAPRWPVDQCSTCGAPIVWTITTRLRSMPVDAQPDPDGNVLLTPGLPGGQPRAEVIGNPARLFGRTAYTSHFARCPQADRHRRPRTRSRP
jgi:hypothetical protein